jgi:hypothetical protein
MILGCFLASGLVFFLFKKNDWSLGLFLGGILSTLNLFSLRWIAGRILQGGTRRSGGPVWIWNLARWMGLALACWGLVQISAFCLLGALAGYFWFLFVLSWVGKKSGLGSVSDKT